MFFTGFLTAKSFYSSSNSDESQLIKLHKKNKFSVHNSIFTTGLNILSLDRKWARGEIFIMS